jgi:hypothetical protein
MTAAMLCLVTACGAEEEAGAAGDIAEIQSAAREPDGFRENFDDETTGASLPQYYSGVGGVGSCQVATDDAPQGQKSYKLNTGTGASGTYHFASAKLCLSDAGADATTTYSATYKMKLDNLQPWTMIGVSSASAYLAWWWIDGTGQVYEGSGGVITTIAAGTWHDVAIDVDTATDSVTFAIGAFSRTVTLSTTWAPAAGAFIDCLRLRTSFTGPQVLRIDQFRGRNR